MKRALLGIAFLRLYLYAYFKMPIERVHIVGCGPRSGTTLLTELMRTSFNIDLTIDHEATMSTMPPRKGRVFLTKKPRDIVVVGEALKRMENLTVLYMVRDPRDMVVSKHGKSPDEYYASLKYWKHYSECGKELAGHPRFLTIKYEELVSDPDGMQEMISEKIPFLEKTRNFSDYGPETKVSEGSRQALKSVRKITSKSIGSWKNHLPRVKQQIQLHGGITQDLINHGYEDSHHWEEILDEVKAGDFKSHRGEFFTKKEMNKLHRRKKIKAHLAVIGHSTPVLSVKSLFYRS